MTIGIIGCGWLGLKIAKHLKQEHDIFVTTTSKTKENHLQDLGLNPTLINFLDSDIIENHNYWERLHEIDSLIITVPFSKRTSITLLKNRFSNLSLFIDNFDKQVFLMSSIGIYPQTDIEITETTFTEKDLNPSILFVERFMRERYPQINILRLGGLMGANRVFSNYKVSNLNQVVNHVHYVDICNIIEKMIALKISNKTYNVVAPLHPTKSAVISYQKGDKAHEEIDDSFGRRVQSDKLQTELEYRFTYPNPITFHLE